MNSLETFVAKLRSVEESFVGDYVQELLELVSVVNLDQILASELRSWSARYRHQPRLSKPNVLPLMEGSWFSLSLRRVDHTEFQSVVWTQDCDAVFIPLVAVTVSEYLIEGAEEIQNASGGNPLSKASLTFTSDRTLTPTDALLVRCKERAFEFSAPTICLCLSSRRLATYKSWFHKPNGAFGGHQYNYPIHTSLELISSFLGYYGEESNVACLEPLLNHDVEGIRWQAAVAISRADPLKGSECMRLLAGGSNGSIATAAHEFIKRIEAGAPHG